MDAIDGPVDLVGHDWGALLTYRVATAYGDRLHSWAADVAHLAHPDYEWDDFANVQKTPGDGEAFIESQDTLSAEELTPVFASMGVPQVDALEMAAATDLTMGGCILDLYRSAMPNPHADRGPWVPTSAAGSILDATQDPLGDERLAGEVASSLGARSESMAEAGHFWPYEAPDAGAAHLESFWTSLV